ncbi:hypothetical protein ACH5RR_021644 [Cinchona calisaya]|uniref:R13L1/DRL21-like LRR repeat region domain-containing protein n=1 Tax=Cinchona calisaya TaxID=153742 RepID=A0ABD2ZL45_9GENT
MVKKEAQKADLSRKPNMDELLFEWRSCREGDNNDEDVLEGLQPHPNLQYLKLRNYIGGRFPQWFLKMALRLESTERRFDRMVKLRLIHCNMCEEVPALGQLPSLQILELNGLDNVRCIGPAFYGIGDHSASRSNNSSGQVSTNSGQVSAKLFPALKSLWLSNMPNLIEWMEAKADDEVFEVFPNLEDLKIITCSKLTSAPSNFPNLKRLKIEKIDRLLPVKKICSNATTLTALWIKGMVELTFVQEVLNDSNLQSLILEECPNLIDIHGCGISLKELRILVCENLKELPKDIHQLQNLRILVIVGCRNFESIAIPSGRLGLMSLCHLTIAYCNRLTSLPSEMLESRTSLWTLNVLKCPNLASFQIDLQQLPSLVFLSLFKCPKLTTIPKGFDHVSSLSELYVGPFMDSTAEFEILSALSSSSVRKLSLHGWPHSVSLPEQLQYLTGLAALDLHGFGMEALPNWLGDLVSLQELSLSSCKKLRYLPSMRSLAKLRSLRIFHCPLLRERCTPWRGTNSEWAKVSHIPNICIENEFIQMSSI